MTSPEARVLLERWIFVLVRVGQDFLAPFTAEAWHSIAGATEYGAEFLPFLQRVLQTLQDPQWVSGTYFPGAYFRFLQQAQRPLPEAEMTGAALAPFFAEEVLVDGGGNWFVGAKQVNGRVLRHFLHNLHFDAALQRYQIRYWLETYFETRYIHHQSPPLRVEGVLSTPQGFQVILNDGSEHPLRPETLRLDHSESLYCAVKEQGLAAIFEDNARWRVLDQVEARGRKLVLPLPHREVSLQLDAPLDFAGMPPAA